MRIGIAYNIREGSPDRQNLPEDFDEEFDSPATIDAIAGVLEGAGHQVIRLGFGRKLLGSLLDDPPDMVFNIAEGLEGRNRESQIPALLEMLSIPYTGSDALSLGLTLDKDLAKRVVASRGLPTPLHFTVGDGRPIEKRDLDGMTFPLIVKPADEGSSKGIRLNSRAGSIGEVNLQVRRLFETYGGPVLVEEFLAGDEFTVGVIGNDPPAVLGVMMIRHRTLPPQDFLYSLEVKRDWENQVEYLCPPPVSGDLLSEISKLALGVYDALGCRDVSRIDIRLRDGRPHFLEVNPLPGLSPEYGDLVIMSRLMGWSYEQLIMEILKGASQRVSPRSSTT